MRTEYRISPEVIKAARDRGGFTSDEALAVSLGISSNTIRRAREGQGVTFSTGIALLNAAGVSIPIGIYRTPQVA